MILNVLSERRDLNPCLPAGRRDWSLYYSFQNLFNKNDLERFERKTGFEPLPAGRQARLVALLFFSESFQ